MSPAPVWPITNGDADAAELERDIALRTRAVLVEQEAHRRAEILSFHFGAGAAGRSPLRRPSPFDPPRAAAENIASRMRAALR